MNERYKTKVKLAQMSPSLTRSASSIREPEHTDDKWATGQGAERNWWNATMPMRIDQMREVIHKACGNYGLIEDQHLH